MCGCEVGRATERLMTKSHCASSVVCMRRSSRSHTSAPGLRRRPRHATPRHATATATQKQRAKSKWLLLKHRGTCHPATKAPAMGLHTSRCRAPRYNASVTLGRGKLLPEAEASFCSEEGGHEVTREVMREVTREGGHEVTREGGHEGGRS